MPQKRLFPCRLLFLVLLLPVLSPAPLAAGDKASTVPVFVSGRSGPGLSPHLEFFRDPTGRLTVRQAASPANAAKFKPLPEGSPSWGITRDVIWLRFRLRLGEGPLLLTLERPPVIGITLFWRNGDAPAAAWKKLRLLNREKSGSNRQWGLNVIPLPRGPSGRTIWVYLRAHSLYTSMFLPLAIETPQQHLNSRAWNRYAMGAYVGVAAAMALLNLFFFSFLRDKLYLLYSLNVLCWAAFFTEVTGVAADLLWQAGTAVRNISVLTHRLSIVSLGLGLAFSAWFSRQFLLSKQNFPTGDMVLKGLVAGGFALSVLGLFAEHLLLNEIAGVFGMANPVLIITIGAVCWHRGFSPARFFLLAWSFICLGGLVFALVFNGLIPYTPLTYYGFQIGSALDMMLLGIALADRFKSLAEERSRLWDSQRRYRQLSITDELTGLFNQRYFNQRIESEIALSRSTGKPLSLLVADVDDFKKFNDAHGHLAGDRALMVLGGVILGCLRESDAPCRYGGEEFAIILPGVTLTEAREIAERIRVNMAASSTVPGEDTPGRVTVSLGVCQWRPGEAKSDFFARTDQALYQAKKLGKNQVFAGGEPPRA